MKSFSGSVPLLLVAILLCGCRFNANLDKYSYPDLYPEGTKSRKDGAQIRERQVKFCMDAAWNFSFQAEALRGLGYVVQGAGYVAAGTSAFFLAGAQGLNQGGPMQQDWGRWGLEFAALSGAILALNAIVDFEDRAVERKLAAEGAAYYALLHAQGYDGPWGQTEKNSFDKCADVLEEVASKRVLERVNGDVKTSPEEADKAKVEVEAEIAEAEADKAKAEADKAKAETDKAKAEADKANIEGEETEGEGDEVEGE